MWWKERSDAYQVASEGFAIFTQNYFTIDVDTSIFKNVVPVIWSTVIHKHQFSLEIV